MCLAAHLARPNTLCKEMDQSLSACTVLPLKPIWQVIDERR